MHPVMVRVGIASLALMLAETVALSKQLTPRAPAKKESYQTLSAMPASDRVTVKFRDGLKVRLGSEGLEGLSASDLADFAAALRAAGVGGPAIRRLHRRAEAELDVARAEGQAESGEELADLNNYYVIKLPEAANAAALADRLNGLSSVEYAAPAPKPAPPPADIAPKTPSFVSQQGYLKDGRTGVGALDPDRYKGGDGAGIRVVDVEYDWRLDHEDLEIPASRIVTGGETPSVSGKDHGAAVLGEIVGKENKYGVKGIVPGAIAYVSPAITVESDYSPARGVLTAGEVMRRGDVMVLEMQYWACGQPTNGDGYGPIEELQEVFDAIRSLTARGVIVTSAAGNGGLDLDSPACGGKFDRKVRDSKAIIVGAGSSAAHSRLSFSSFGSRVDVQGWGENVMTTGYGDRFDPTGDPRQFYTTVFNGTSSATPVVAGAIIAIQGARKACGLAPLTPKAMRKALIDTGTKQGPGAGHIGPLPRILPALKSTDAKSCVEKAERASAEAASAAMASAED